jgi:hypothetical protein
VGEIAMLSEENNTSLSTLSWIPTYGIQSIHVFLKDNPSNIQSFRAEDILQQLRLSVVWFLKRAIAELSARGIELEIWGEAHCAHDHKRYKLFGPGSFNKLKNDGSSMETIIPYETVIF